MKKVLLAAFALAAAITSCKMENPLLTESPLEYGAPQFDKIIVNDDLETAKQETLQIVKEFLG